ncbi:MAG: hypothetical protein JXR10_02600 [Cyclobacteriaceae bacterium]
MEKYESLTRKISSLIYKERSNTILEHFRTWFHGNERHYFGNISDDQFQIWRFTRGAQGFHPVITGKISITEHGEPTVNLKATLNPLGYLQAILGTIGLIFMTVFILPTNTNIFINFLVVFGISMIVAGIVYFAYKYETRHHLEQLDEELSKLQQ